jgi:ring-1,2-phenylacetyl-CoA epoxidase subunit PaaE
MIGTILKFEPKSKITLLYANRTSDSIIFSNKLKLWAKEFPNVFTIKHYLSEEEKPKDAINGYVTRIALEELVNKKNIESIEFYLCGPEIMTNKLIRDLIYLGIDTTKIHRELFLINILKQNLASEKAKVNAKIFGVDYEFETAEEQTILQSALMQNIPLPYSCQSGLCGMCKMKCTDGKVLMKNNQVLNESEVKQGYILTCQSLPQSSKLKINN